MSLSRYRIGRTLIVGSLLLTSPAYASDWGSRFFRSCARLLSRIVGSDLSDNQKDAPVLPIDETAPKSSDSLTGQPVRPSRDSSNPIVSLKGRDKAFLSWIEGELLRLNWTVDDLKLALDKKIPGITLRRRNKVIAMLDDQIHVSTIDVPTRRALRAWLSAVQRPESEPGGSTEVDNASRDQSESAALTKPTESHSLRPWSRDPWYGSRSKAVSQISPDSVSEQDIETLRQVFDGYEKNFPVLNPRQRPRQRPEIEELGDTDP